MVHFVGAGPGAVDLITVRGQRLLQEADVVIYAGSLVNPALLQLCRRDCEIWDSAKMTLEEIMAIIIRAEEEGKTTVRLHTGDTSLYSALTEQREALAASGIDSDVCPGVSAFSGAAAALKTVYTLPGVTQSVVITRAAGKTPVPDRESIERFAAHQSTMVLFLSTGLAHEVREALIRGGYAPDTPAAVVYKATWPEEKVLLCTVDTLPDVCESNHIAKTALLIVGRALAGADHERSRLYDPSFSTGYRKGTD